MGSRFRLASPAVLLPFVIITILIIQLCLPQLVYVTGQTLNTTNTSAPSYFYYNNSNSNTILIQRSFLLKRPFYFRFIRNIVATATLLIIPISIAVTPIC
jgi:hypothetical protein